MKDRTLNDKSRRSFIIMVAGLGGAMMAPSIAMAEDMNKSRKAPPIPSKVDARIVTLLNIAGRQRMLSQMIVKDYLYMGKKIAVAHAKKEEKEAIKEFERNLKVLKASINDPEILNLIEFVKMSLDQMKDIIKQPFSLDNAQIAIDLGESMLEGSQYTVNSLSEKYKLPSIKIINISGKQSLLAQRIAKYYIAYQSGIKDKNTVDQMKKTVAEFTKNLEMLKNNPRNTPTINQRLNEVDRLWKIVYKFYLNIEKGGLPFIVYTTANKITKEMDKITKMYEKIYAGV